MLLTAKKETEAGMDDINNILRDLSIGKNYKGHREIAYAVQLLLEDEDRLCAVVKEVYIPVAKHFNVEWNAVERNLRTAISRVWRLRRQRLFEIAGYEMEEPPTGSEFLDILLSYAQRQENIKRKIIPFTDI
nr:MAG TPA: Sporulation initiation factor Spo0A C terminal [Caudoviricetes sp.]